MTLPTTTLQAYALASGGADRLVRASSQVPRGALLLRVPGTQTKSSLYRGAMETAWQWARLSGVLPTVRCGRHAMAVQRLQMLACRSQFSREISTTAVCVLPCLFDLWGAEAVCQMQGAYLEDPMLSFVHRFGLRHRHMPFVAKPCRLYF